MPFSFRVLIAEDHALMREALTHLLSEFCTVVGTVETGDGVLDAVQQSQPDAIVLDVSMPGRSGLQVLPELRAAYPRLTIIMLSNHDAEPYRKAAATRDADGYVLKQDASRVLWPALKAAMLDRPRRSSQDRVVSG